MYHYLLYQEELDAWRGMITRETRTFCLTPAAPVLPPSGALATGVRAERWILEGLDIDTEPDRLAFIAILI